MKKLFFLLFAFSFCLMGWGNNHLKVQVAGPERTYNMVRVINMTHFTNFNCLVYFLTEKDGKQVIASSLGSYQLAETGDGDSNRVKVAAGQWLGVSLPDEMVNVTAKVTYKNFPLFDVVDINLMESAPEQIGTEF